MKTNYIRERFITNDLQSLHLYSCGEEQRRQQWWTPLKRGAYFLDILANGRGNFAIIMRHASVVSCKMIEAAIQCRYNTGAVYVKVGSINASLRYQKTAELPIEGEVSLSASARLNAGASSFRTRHGIRITTYGSNKDERYGQIQFRAGTYAIVIEGSFDTRCCDEETFVEGIKEQIPVDIPVDFVKALVDESRPGKERIRNGLAS